MSSSLERFEARLRRSTEIMTRSFKETDFYEEIFKSRLLAKADVVMGIILIAEALLFWKRGVILWNVFQAFVGFVGFGMISTGRFRMKFVYRDFCEHRIVPLGRSLHARDPEMEIWIPTRRVFRRSDDLRNLEKQFCEQLFQDFWKIERRRKEKRKKERWDTRNDKLREELLGIVRTCHLSEDDKGELEEKVLEIWESLPLNPDRRKRFVSKVQNGLLHWAFQAQYGYSREESALLINQTASEEREAVDWRLRLLETEAKECESDAARALCAQALRETDRRTRIRLLGNAIREERQSEDSSASQIESVSPIAVAPASEVKFIKLDELMEKKFQIAHLVPSSLDAAMAKEILLELLDPGSQQRRFQKAYRPESRLKHRVQQRYESWVQAPFDARSFYDTLAWLVDEGIVFTKRKKEDVYSLQANNFRAKSETARALIAAVIRLDREIRDS